eukprot:gene59-4308_t
MGKTKFDEILEPYISEELIKDVKIKKNNLYFIVDLIDKEFEVEVKTLNSEKYDLIYEGESHIYQVSSEEEALLLFLSQMQELRDANIEKYGVTPLSNTSAGEYDYSTPTPTENATEFFEEEQILQIESIDLDRDEKEMFQKKLEESFKKLTKDIKEANLQLTKHKFVLFTKKPDRFIVRISLNMEWLGKTSTRAMGIDEKRDLIIEFEFDHLYLNSPNAPKIDSKCVFQTYNDIQQRNIKDKHIGSEMISWFISNRLGSALRKNWLLKDQKNYFTTKQENLKEIVQPNKKENDLEKLSSLISNGFSKKYAYFALQEANGNLEEATLILLDGHLNSYFDSLKYPPNESSKPEKKKKKEKSGNSKTTTSQTNENLSQEFFNREVNYGKNENFRECGNFFIGMVAFLKYKLENIGELCVICDNKLSFHGIKPTICDRPLCIHAMEQYGLGIDLLIELNSNVEVLDLLCSLTYTSARLCLDTNGVRDITPSPANTIGEGKKMTDMELAKEVIKIIDNIPSDLKSLSYQSGGDSYKLKEILNKCDERILPLLRWIISSNRSHVVFLKDEKKIPKVPKAVWQFLMASAPPKREQDFQTMKSTYGSFYAFHGSAIGNWHCILRGGLKNYSGTSKMSAGAVYGAGIYLGKGSGISSRYSRTSSGYWKNSIINGYTCMAICEVINNSTGFRSYDWGYVVTDESLVITRYFLVFGSESNSYSMNIIANSLVYPSFY